MSLGASFSQYFWQLCQFCNKICRLPTSPDTKRIGSKHQEHADICRNMQDSDANKKRRHQIFHRWFAIYGMQSAAPSADRQKWGAAVTAPHGAFRSAAPRLGGARRVRPNCDSADPCQTPKASAGQPSAADPTPNFAFCRPWRHFSICLNTFCRSKIHQKSDSSKTLPKSQKWDPRAPNVRFLTDFGSILGAILGAARLGRRLFDFSRFSSPARSEREKYWKKLSLDLHQKKR